ncbi:MAG: acetyl-CoA carboxylase biotin carboxylase subunit [Bacteroidota bacterium]|nr:acetyl-CoA carboxylase biotin carboxylase subunit [Bacteroidota bacterium]
MEKITKILVANRGEIALRIMKTCKKLGISTVAIYSEADKSAPFVKFADQSVLIGPPPSSESYLKQDEIIEVAKNLNVDGIHPGYGFLSENSSFAQKVIDAGIKFIGPSGKSIEIMGDKLSAKKAVLAYDIPMVPGLNEEVTDVDKAKKVANQIGYPILIKAAAGGGGKGMRIVENDSEFENQMKRAVSEAKNAFGNGAVFIEKYITEPRHIEIQILADQHGNVVHLFERDCSIQRRHQKVIEEAPSSVLSEKLRAEMGKAACDVARSCDYYGAGTVEFIYENDSFYFLEMNTRLQVEHPVTELITGLDLVEQQIKIAEGEKLSFAQEDLKINGHAIEIRVYAEDPTNDFLPDIGTVDVYSIPTGDHVRVDDALEQHMEIPIFYDPMIAKLIVHDSTREKAIQRMIEAIEDYDIVGVKTTLPFCDFALKHESFRSGKYDTRFVKLYFSDPKVLDPSLEMLDAALATVALLEKNDKINDYYLPSAPTNWVSNR